MEPKGNLTELSLFLKYGLTKVIGHKSMEIESKTLVNYIWCKYVLSLRLKVHQTSKVVQKH